VGYNGESVSISADGLTIAIGAPGNNNDNYDSGQVRIFKYDGTSWNQLGSDIYGETSDDESGKSVSISADGTTVAIGATGNNGNGIDSGQVRIYKYDGGSWNQLGSDIDGEASDDESGHSISLSADGLTVAIGATRNDGAGENSGHVRIYKYKNGSWNQFGLDIDGEASYDESGFSVSLSADGTTVAIGAPYNDIDILTNGGHVRVYKISSFPKLIIKPVFGTSGTATVTLNANDGDDGETSTTFDLIVQNNSPVIETIENQTVVKNSAGISLDINATDADNDSLYFTANISDTNLATLSISQAFTQLGVDINGEASNDYSGKSVSLSADGLTMAIGSPYNDDNNNYGQVRIYKYINNTWNKIGTIEGYGETGDSVSLSADGLSVIISSPIVGDGYENVKVYSYDGSSWNQVGSTITVSASDVSINTDGTIISIGVSFSGEDDTAPGYVSIYKYNGDSWNRVGSNIYGEASADYSGSSVSLSLDGLSVAISAPGNDDKGTESGQVRIYKYDGTSWNQIALDIDGEAGDGYNGISVSMSGL